MNEYSCNIVAHGHPTDIVLKIYRYCKITYYLFFSKIKYNIVVLATGTYCL
jgi:hypothetical protein